MEPNLVEFQKLAIALALGLLIGLERGWKERSAEEGSRLAGIRTFGLVSLLGALWQLLTLTETPFILGIAFLAFTFLVISVSFIEAKRKRVYGITTSVALMVTFALGALTMRGHTTLAAAATAVTVTLLGIKPVLHSWIQSLESHEMTAVFKLALISAVMLPVLPDQTFDPWQAFNPYQIWWMVVLISSISFSGYFAIKIAGPSRGIFLTGLLAGLASSTAVTLCLSRLGQQHRNIPRVLSAGVIVASVTMFPRILLVISIVQPRLVPLLIWPIGIMSLIGYAIVWWLVKHSETATATSPQSLQLENPFDLSMAIKFGALLAIIMLLSRLLQDWQGHTGIYLLAGISGITDVDAITLSLSQLVDKGITVQLAATAILLAAAVNTFVKGLIVAVISGGDMAKWVISVFLCLILAGIIGAWIGW